MSKEIIKVLVYPRWIEFEVICDANGALPAWYSIVRKFMFDIIHEIHPHIEIQTYDDTLMIFEPSLENWDRSVAEIVNHLATDKYSVLFEQRDEPEEIEDLPTM